MLQGLLFVREDLVEEIAEQHWDLTFELVQVLKPLHILTKQLQAVQYTAGDFIRDLSNCKLDLEELHLNIAYELLSALAIRETLLLDNPHLLAAAYFDPRLCNEASIFLRAEAKAAAVNYLLVTNERMKREQREADAADAETDLEEDMDMVTATSSGTINIPHQSTPTSSKRRENAWFLRPTFAAQTALNTPAPTSAARSSLKMRLENLAKLPLPLGDFDVMEHWKFISKNDKELADLAAVVLAVPVSQVSVERFFNALPQILTKFRTSIGAKNLQKLIFVKLNVNNID